MKRQRGFTLLELLMAFALLTVALGILIAILGGGLTQVRQSGDASVAALHAQSMLDELGVMGALQEGEYHGEFDDGRYRWEMQVSRLEDPLPAAAPVDPVLASPIERAGRNLGEPVLYRVQLDMAWGQDDVARSLRLVTLRARLPPQGELP